MTPSIGALWATKQVEECSSLVYVLAFTHFLFALVLFHLGPFSPVRHLSGFQKLKSVNWKGLQNCHSHFSGEAIEQQGGW